MHIRGKLFIKRRTVILEKSSYFRVIVEDRDLSARNQLS